VNGQAVLSLRASRFALATLESKLCRNVWQIWQDCEQPITKSSSNPKPVGSKADVLIHSSRCKSVQAGYLKDLIIVMLKLMKLLPQIAQIM